MIIPIVDIKLDPEVQLRAGLNHERVQMFVDLYTEGIGVPPITVVGLDNLLADGHHRLAARVIVLRPLPWLASRTTAARCP